MFFGCASSNVFKFKMVHDFFYKQLSILKLLNGCLIFFRIIFVIIRRENKINLAVLFSAGSIFGLMLVFF